VTDYMRCALWINDGEDERDDTQVRAVSSLLFLHCSFEVRPVQS